MQKMQAPFVFDMVDKTDVTILSDPMQENVEQKITRIYTNYCEAGLVVYIVNALLLVSPATQRYNIYLIIFMYLGWSSSACNWHCCTLYRTS